MPNKRSNEYGYIEWEADADAADRRADERAAIERRMIESLFDAEARRRFGELIARAARAGKTKKK